MAMTDFSGDMPSSGYNAARVMLDPNDPQYLKKLAASHVMEGQHEMAMNARDKAAAAPAPEITSEAPSPEAPSRIQIAPPNLKDPGVYKHSVSDLRNTIATSPDRMTALKAEDELIRLQSQNPWGSPANHPGILGKIAHGAALAGNAAGDIFAPAQMAMIPGTQLYNQRRNAGIERGLTEAQTQEIEKQRASAAQQGVGVKQQQADTAEQRADTAQQRADTYREMATRTKPISLNELQAQWAQGLVGKPNPATGKPFTEQEALAAFGPAARQVNDAYHEWLASHPGGTYDEFLKDESNIKRSGSVGQAIALGRMVALGYQYDPRILDALPQLLSGLGISVPGLQGAPAGQPVSEQGTPIGTHSPEAPTQQTRSRAQMATEILPIFPKVAGLIDELNGEGKIGPAAGRVNDFLTSDYGAGDPRFKELRNYLTTIASGFSRQHLNTEKGLEPFNNMLGGQMTAENLKAGLGVLSDFLSRYKQGGKGLPAATSVTPPSGAKIRTWNPATQRLE